MLISDVVGCERSIRSRDLSETDRKPYDAKAAADKKRYEEEKAASLHHGGL